MNPVPNAEMIKLSPFFKRPFFVASTIPIGIVAAGGKNEKPFVKAGHKFYTMRARNRLWPKTSGVAMNSVDHPFGSGRGRHIGKSKVAPRNAPPGRKVGPIRPRRLGIKKGKRQ